VRGRPKTTGEAGGVLASRGNGREASPIRVPDQEFRLFGQVVTGVGATSTIDLAAKKLEESC